MAHLYRQLLSKELDDPEYCSPGCNSTDNCPSFCYGLCPSYCPSYLISLPPPPVEGSSHAASHISPFLIILITVLTSAFLLVSYYAIIVKYCSNWNTRFRRSPPPRSDDIRQDFLDENHGPVLDHPIWYITTVGLQDSIINSITVCKYKRGDGLTEGTECSVCLNEFEDDETLRLLPKCSHAFHLPCIDTWLRSHKNCPLCRAPIVASTSGPQTTTPPPPNSNNLPAGDEILVENSQSDPRLGSNQTRERGVCDLMGVGTENEEIPVEEDGRSDSGIPKDGVPSPLPSSGFRVPCDLRDSRREVEDEMQPVGRSVSMDSSQAAIISFSIANSLQLQSEGSSSTRLVLVNKSDPDIVIKHVSESPSVLSEMGSSSIGRSLLKGPVSMKRSFSSGGKFLSRYGRSRNSILPL
ncbi:PREDICTED: RING-H2 finger protein ATL52-like [Nelumbo nucifera]|uniref:RING-type E3 ubiquitin transferase n=2 Tax=Nelumbo nucifera TaxID=4432 RepID=A0A1U8BA53_NELNU|nr:PREDICTED: RING-H2 finger protein ATL52-like [Nelumbo nucifera]DAD22038.1 TPA_asm: hypothetical protein HUJ06_023501 [Nelumbo nucifera]